MVTRSLKRLAATIGIATLLFSQLAVAVHACPLTANAVDYSHAAMADNPHATMAGCEESAAGDNDAGNTKLCMQHCQAGSQSVKSSQQVQLPGLAMLPPLIVAQTELHCDITSPALHSLLERETSPPPLLRFCVLRI